MSSFLVGPELKLRNHTRATPFADALGITHTSTAFRTSGAALNFSGSTGDTGLGMAFGGGLDMRIMRLHPQTQVQVALELGFT